MIRKIVDVATEWNEQGKTIRLKKFARHLSEEHGIVLSSKTVGDILVANDLREKKTRKKRPKFYQSLCQRIPNGLLSIDGSEFTVFLGDDSYKFNVEAGVDVVSNLHTAYSISKTETAEEVLKVLEEHMEKWGQPLGVLYDHGSANLSQEVDQWLKENDVKSVPAGPANPKGNGTIEGAFGWLKRTVGDIRIDMSSKETIAKSVLEILISVYVKMHRRLELGGDGPSRIELMQTVINPETREFEKKRLADYLKSRMKSDDSPRLKLLYSMIQQLNMNPDIKAVKRAQQTIVHYDMASIQKAEKAFVKAVKRKSDRLNLAYFFGILKRIQQEQDDLAYADYCRGKYEYNQIFEREAHEKELRDMDKPPSIDQILEVMLQGITIKQRRIQEFAMNGAVEWIEQLKKTVEYIKPLQKKFMDAIAELKDISLEQKKKLQQIIVSLLAVKNQDDRVTSIS